MSEIETNQIGRYISIIHRSIQTNMNHELTLPGLTASNAHFLQFINDYGQVTPQQIATQLAINKGLVSRSLDGLIKHGYVLRAPDSTDRRSYVVHLTPAGKSACQVVAKIMATWWQQQFAASGMAHQDVVYGELRKVAETLVGGPLQFAPVEDK